MDILHNAPLWAALIGFFAAQAVKPFINVIIEKQFNWHLLFSTGGMPSSHTAGVCALATSVAMTEGVGSVYFAICVAFGGITIHDAMGIRRAAGKQAEVINEWSAILADIHKDGRFTEEHLKTMLGHSFSQVLGGGVFGLIIGIVTTLLIP